MASDATVRLRTAMTVPPPWWMSGEELLPEHMHFSCDVGPEGPEIGACLEWREPYMRPGAGRACAPPRTRPSVFYS